MNGSDEIKKDLSTLIFKHTRQILIGSSLFIFAAILNISYDFFLRLAINYGLSPYVVRTLFYVFSYGYLVIMAIGILPIAIGIREITDIYFVDHITKAGRSASSWLFLYAAAFLIDMILVGWPLTAGFAGLAILFGRILGFIKLNTVLAKIRDVFKLKISSAVYVIFAYFTVIISLLSFIANYAEDATFQTLIFVFNGPIDSLIMTLVGIKLIIDILRIKKFIVENDIKPYSTKTSLFVKDRRATPSPATTKEHLQSKTSIERLQEKSQERTEMIESFRRERRERKWARKRVKVEKYQVNKEDYFNCPKCDKRTSMSFPLCTSCGASIKEETEKMKKRQKAEEIIKEKEEIKKIQSKRMLTPKRERILQQLVLIIFLVAFVTYAFVTANTTLIVYSWIIIAIAATYIIVNFVALFFVETGFVFTTVFLDMLYLFIILPTLNVIFTYFILLGFERGFNIPENTYRTLLWSISVSLYLLSLFLTLLNKIRGTDMSIKEYIKHRFDFKERAEEIEEETKRAEKKRSYFDKLDKIEEHMEKQRREKIMDYEDFDYKERLKDLGSPLSEDDEA